MEIKDIVLDPSVISGEDHRIKAYLGDHNIIKFINSVKYDKEFKWEGNILHFIGDQKKGRTLERHEKNYGPVGAQQVKLFKPLLEGPVFKNHNGTASYLQNLYRGCTAFLICSGPSLNEVDTDKMYLPGILKMGVNNSPSVVRPNLWCCVDPAEKFLKSIWYDPTIMKFVGDGYRKKKLWDSRADHRITDRVVGDCPNIYYLDRNTVFNPSTWITEQSFNWGNNASVTFYADDGTKCSGTRSCMLFAMKILIQLGVRTIFLVGCDFNMKEGQPYAFEQGKSSGGVSGNNSAYQNLDVYLSALRPEFEKIGVNVFNTNPNSGLKAFKYYSYEKAIEFALSDIGDVTAEVTAGHYDSEKKRDPRKNMIKDKGPIQGLWVPEKWAFISEEGEIEEVAEEPDEPEEEEQAEEIVPEINGSPVAPEVKTRIWDAKEIWVRREEFVKIYPKIEKHMVSSEKRLFNANKDSSCKGCLKKRELAAVSSFFQSLLVSINEEPNRFLDNELSKGVDQLILNGKTINIEG